jgi:hypothetical protein
MYVEIPPDSIPVLKPQLKEGKVVVMKKFVVEQAKPEYKVVPNPYMLRLRTRITTEPSMFPKVTYMLTPLSELEQYKGSTERFLGMHKYFLSSKNVTLKIAAHRKIIYKLLLFMYRRHWTDNASVRCCKLSHSSWNNADAKENHSQRYQVSNIVKDFS